MRMIEGKARLLGAVVVAMALTVPSAVLAEEGEWSHWGADAASSRYSPLDQINAGNFEDLSVAWTWRCPATVVNSSARSRSRSRSSG